jgi:4-amino-4-deoxy-L-arabinose transferase-like glycosyltransferase
VEVETTARRSLLLLGIVALAVVVRLAGIDDRLSDAEGYSWLVASAPNAGAFFDRLAAYENTPPLFYALLAPLPLGDEAWLRLPALLPALACVPVAYCLVRPLLGTRVALLTALAVAVAPFHVSYSNYSRGFMLAALGLLLAAWAVARLAEGRRTRWWWLYLAGGTLALQSEYDALLFLAPLVALPALWRRRGWKEVVLLGALPLVTLLPLVGEMLRGLDQLDVTKLTPPSPDLSPASLRDSLVSLFTGTHGLLGSAAGRALQVVVLVGALALAATWLWRRFGRLARLEDGQRDIAFWLLVVAPATAVVLHAVASIPGPEIFDSRYLVGLLPFACALLACAIDALPWRWAMPAAAACLLALAVAVFVQRHDRALQPDVTPAAELVAASGVRTVLTNSPVVAYYLRDSDAEVLLDRPFGLGNDEPGCVAPSCPHPLAVVEDGRLPGGVRGGLGQPAAFGPIVVRVVP